MERFRELFAYCTKICLMLYPSTDSSQTGFKWVVQGVRLGNVLSTFPYLVYNDDLLDELEKSKGCKVGIIDCSCPSYVDDGALVVIHFVICKLW